MSSTDAASCSYNMACIDEEEKVVSNQMAIQYELERRRTGSGEIVADIHYSSMSSLMEQSACDLAAFAMETFDTEQEIARCIKEGFDRGYGKAWQCICGRHFGPYVTFEPDSFIYFRIGSTAFMLFRAMELSAPQYELERRRTGSGEIVADIHYSSMSSLMEQSACDLAAFAMETFDTEQEIARCIKEGFDRGYGKAWQCICGRHFGSYVTFEPDSFIYFRIGSTAFMLFRAMELSAPQFGL